MNLRRSRNAYTLVELLVVIAILAGLAALTVAFLPNAAASAREARAATQVQSWLTNARTRALRDQAGRGVRFWVKPYIIGSTTITNGVVECQFLEQPDDFTGGTITTPALNTVVFNLPGGGDLTLGYPVPPMPASDMQFWSVQIGDNLEITGTGLMHQIVSFVDPYTVVIAPPLPYPITTPTASYRIVRAPRTVGDETLKMPDGTLIDLDTNAAYGNPQPIIGGALDVLFSPSGAVISRGTTTTNINLWVRAPELDFPADPYRGDPTIVSIFARTGFVGAFKISPASAGSPYLLVK